MLLNQSIKVIRAYDVKSPQRVVTQWMLPSYRINDISPCNTIFFMRKERKLGERNDTIINWRQSLGQSVFFSIYEHFYYNIKERTKPFNHAQ